MPKQGAGFSVSNPRWQINLLRKTNAIFAKDKKPKQLSTVLRGFGICGLPQAVAQTLARSDNAFTAVTTPNEWLLKAQRSTVSQRRPVKDI